MFRIIKKITAALIIGTLAFSTNANAEPDETTRYFMDSPANIFELGLLRLKIYFNDQSDSRESLKGTIITYSRDKDAIMIIQLKEKGEKEFCPIWIKNVRAIAAVSFETGEVDLYSFSKSSLFAGMFRYTGYTKENMKKYQLLLDKKFKLLCNVSSGGGAHRADLLGTTYSIDKK